MGTGGGIYGYNSIDDPNATMSQKLTPSIGKLENEEIYYG